jgi:hypothetical protein
MREGTRTALPIEGRSDEELVQRAVEAARGAPPEDRVASGLEAMIAIAETEPAAARAALTALRANHLALERLERCLGGGAKRATFALGGAIQLALSELAAPKPDLRGRRAELMRWLEGGW